MALFSSSSNSFWGSRYTSSVCITADLDCKVFENDQELGAVKVGSPLCVELQAGKHKLTFVFTDDADVSKNIIYNVAEEDHIYRLSVELTEAFCKTVAKYNKTKNYNTLYLLCIKAAQQDNSTAQYELGNCYWNGKGVAKNLEKAFEWYFKAANKGLPHAQNQLGNCYQYGEGVKKDIRQALEWHTKAAEQGDAFSQIALGDYYYRGANNMIKSKSGSLISRGVRQLIMAAENYQKAMEQGVWSGFKAALDCWYNVGSYFESGIGVGKDLSKAMKWYSKSAKSGNQNAQQALDRLKQNGIKPVKYIFFDTETTGIPRDYNAPTSDSRNWPRLVQLSWITTDEDCNALSQNDFIVYPDGFSIPFDAARVHGITTNIAKEKGELLRNVIKNFIDDFDTAQIIVGHNIAFDKKIVGAELVRLGKKDMMDSKKSLCTMESSTDYCKIPGFRGYKYPKLQELHKKLFGYEFKDAHNSMSDVIATLKCFKEMRKKGLI